MNNVTMERANLYTLLHNAYVKAYSTKSKQVCQKEVNKIWKRIKSDENLYDTVESHVKECEAIAKKKGQLINFWASQALKPDA